MGNYYFTSSALPKLKVGERPEMGSHIFTILLKLNLSSKDYQRTVDMRRLVDINNLRALWRGDQCDPRGNYNKKQMEEIMILQEGLPEYVYDYIEQYNSVKDRLKFFPALVSTAFGEEISHQTGFTKTYFEFERGLRLALLGFRAKKLGRDLMEELQYEDPEDDVVAQIVAQKDSKKYEPPAGFEDLKDILEEDYNRPYRLYKKLCEYRFNRIEDFLIEDLFSIDRVLGYMAQLFIVEKWLELDNQEGQKIVNKIIEKV